MAITAVITGNPILVTGTTNTNDSVIEGPVFVKYIYWYKPTTIGHLLNVTDQHGLIVIPMYCEVADQSQMWPLWTQYDGLRINDMDSGTVYIYRS